MLLWSQKRVQGGIRHTHAFSMVGISSYDASVCIKKTMEQGKCNENQEGASLMISCFGDDTDREGPS